MISLKRALFIHVVITAFFIPNFTITKTKDSAKITKNNNFDQTCYCDFCNEIRANSSIKTEKCKKKRAKKAKRRTFIVYMAADNDLRAFAARNIQQMSSVGSNQNITIVVHLDIRISGNKKITRRYLIEKDRVLHVEPYDPLTQQMDSGNPATLISCCEWAIKNYPADEYDLILWNHGTGILEPPHGKIINPTDLFTFNPITYRLELDRSIGFFEAFNLIGQNQRGICWDDTTGNYLSNKQLDLALQTICQKCLGGRKFGIIGFDACLMSMIEVASFIKKYARAMASSQEVELGMGWKYDEVLYPFSREPLDTFSFASHIVDAYENTYQSITHDYTFSAINLDNIDLLEKNIDIVSSLLIEGLSSQKVSFSRAIKDSRNKLACTHFDEPSYIDLHHLYTNLLNNIKKINVGNEQRDQQIQEILLGRLKEGIELIEKIVINNTTGRNLKNAQGISIYFPERTIHSSYQYASFITSNHWGLFLTHYLF
jgi:cysteine peptidase C11 family protein